MDLAHPTKLHAAGEHLGPATGLQKRVALALSGTETRLLDTQLCQQLLHDALAVEEA